MHNQPVNFIDLSSKPLLKRGVETNFIYEVENIDFDKIDIESLTNLDAPELVKYILNEKGTLKFRSTEGEIFKNNLVLVDSLLPVLLSNVVMYAFKNNCYILTEILDYIEIINPLDISNLNGAKFYTHKIKGFLRHLALGMEPDVVWYGEGNIYDYYPILKAADSIIYYTENINKFVEILFEKTLIQPVELCNNGDRLYFDNATLFIKLNLELKLQIS